MSDEPETIIYDADEDDENGNDRADDTPDEGDGTHLALALTTPMYPVYQGPSRAEIEALKGTLKAANRDMSDAQFTVFLAAAKHLGLDPLARQIVPIFQNGRMTVQTTIDGFRLIAERTRKYRGQIGPQWCGKDAVWLDVWLADEPPLAARVGVKRSDFDAPMWGVARYKSYHKDTPTWKAMPDVMLAKVAESLALRKTFPAELSGAYTAEELVVDADPTPPTTEAALSPAITPTRPSASKPTPKPASTANTSTPPPGPATDPTRFTTSDGCNPLGDVALRRRMSALNVRTAADVETLLTRIQRQYTAYTRQAIENELTEMEARTSAHNLQEAFPAGASHGA